MKMTKMNEVKELAESIVENENNMDYAVKFMYVSLNDCVTVAKAYLALLRAEEERKRIENGTWII